MGIFNKRKQTLRPAERLERRLADRVDRSAVTCFEPRDGTAPDGLRVGVDPDRRKCRAGEPENLREEWA